MSNAEGFGKGYVNPLYPGVDGGVPLLSSFYFRFNLSGHPEPVDNHIHSIRVLPAGTPQDLTPWAGLPLDVAEPGTIGLAYQDKDEDDSRKDHYFYKTAHVIQPFQSARRFQIRDIGCTGKCEILLPQPPGPHSTINKPVFVLVGFYLFFTGGRDHHIDELGLFEEEGKLTVAFNDKNDDDVFVYVVDYALVSRIGQNVHVGEDSGSAKGSAHVPVSRGAKVIRGFHFDFTEKDHHIREIGVLTGNENLEVYYGDENGDDRFRWRVLWADISPDVVDPTDS
jgi:hypothetical protein